MMIESILTTIAVASLPLVEQRLAIPFGFFSQDLPIWIATTAGLIGNVASVAIVLWLWPIIAKLAAKYSPFCNRILQKIFEKTRTKHSHKFHTWGSIFLVFFVMLPIPGSGGWSGSLIAWLFGETYGKALALISLGLLLGALIIAGMTIGADELITLVNGFFSKTPL